MSNKITLDTATRVDITCRKGDTFKLDLDVTDSSGNALNISGYTFKMEVRTSDTSVGAVTDSDVILSTHAAGGNSKEILVPTKDANGNLLFKVDDNDMAQAAAGLYVYDIQAYDGADTTTWLFGTFKINEDVSI